jgi:hypothetical protein
MRAFPSVLRMPNMTCSLHFRQNLGFFCELRPCIHKLRHIRQLAEKKFSSRKTLRKVIMFHGCMSRSNKSETLDMLQFRI